MFSPHSLCRRYTSWKGLETLGFQVNKDLFRPGVLPQRNKNLIKYYFYMRECKSFGLVCQEKLLILSIEKRRLIIFNRRRH